MPPKLVYSNDAEPVSVRDPELLSSIEGFLHKEDSMRGMSVAGEEELQAFSVLRHLHEEAELPYEMNIWRKQCTDILRIAADGRLESVSRKFLRPTDPSIGAAILDLSDYRETALDLLKRGGEKPAVPFYSRAPQAAE